MIRSRMSDGDRYQRATRGAGGVPAGGASAAARVGADAGLGGGEAAAAPAAGGPGGAGDGRFAAGRGGTAGEAARVPAAGGAGERSREVRARKGLTTCG